MSWLLILVPALGTASFTLEVIVVVLSYYILFCHVWLSPRSLFLSSERQKGSGPGGGGGRDELGGAAEGETVIMLYCMRKQPIFNKRENVFKEVQLY